MNLMVMNLFVAWKMNTFFNFIYHRLCEDEYTYYLCLYILGYEPFCRMEDEYIYLRSCNFLLRGR